MCESAVVADCPAGCMSCCVDNYDPYNDDDDYDYYYSGGGIFLCIMLVILVCRICARRRRCRQPIATTITYNQPAPMCPAPEPGYNYMAESEPPNYTTNDSSIPPAPPHPDDLPADLPAGWSQFQDPASGKYYYSDGVTTTWDRPTAPSDQVNKPSAPPPTQGNNLNERGYDLNQPLIQ